MDKLVGANFRIKGNGEMNGSALTPHSPSTHHEGPATPAICNSPICNVNEVFHNQVTEDSEIQKRLKETVDSEETERNPASAENPHGGKNGEESEEADNEHQNPGLRTSYSVWFEEHKNDRLRNFIRGATAFVTDHHDDVPDWWTPSYLFTWLCSGREEFDAAFLTRKPDAPWKIITAQLESWTTETIGRGERPTFAHNRVTNDHWQNWFGVASADAEVEFFDAWQKIRFRPGQTPLMQAMNRARQCRLLLPDELDGKRPIGNRRYRLENNYEWFISLAGWLQVITGNQDIMLPTHRLDKLCGVTPMTIGRWTNWAIEDGFLKRTRRHGFVRGRSFQVAARYRFNVAMYPATRTAAQKGTSESFMHCSPGAPWEDESK